MTRHARGSPNGTSRNTPAHGQEAGSDPATNKTGPTCRDAPSGCVCTPALVAAALMEQAMRVVESVSDETYCRASARLAGGTIGKHFRHCLDHITAALAPTLDASAVIDYDRRQRNVPMETCRKTAAGQLQSIIGQLRVVDAVHGSLPVRVRVMLTGDGEEIELASTLGRELAFAAHHAVHHHAMIKSIAEEFGEATPGEFGKAPSTINFEQTKSQG